MEYLTMNKAAIQYGVDKHKILAAIRNGEVTGATKTGDGRTSSWSIPVASLEQFGLREPQTTKGTTGAPKITAETAGLDPNEWLSTGEAAELFGGSTSRYQTLARTKAVESKTEMVGNRPVIFLRRDQLAPVREYSMRKAIPLTEPETAEQPKLVRVREAARIVGRPEVTISNWVLYGKVPGRKIRIGPKQEMWLVDLAAVKARAALTRTGRGHKPNVQKGVKGIRTTMGNRTVGEDIQQLLKTGSPPRNLNAELLRLADMVREGSFNVTKLTVGLEFASNG